MVLPSTSRRFRCLHAAACALMNSAGVAGVRSVRSKKLSWTASWPGDRPGLVVDPVLIDERIWAGLAPAASTCCRISSGGRDSSVNVRPNDTRRLCNRVRIPVSTASALQTGFPLAASKATRRPSNVPANIFCSTPKAPDTNIILKREQFPAIYPHTLSPLVTGERWRTLAPCLY